jgi:bifunctional enzyme CysN/CysC
LLWFTGLSGSGKSTIANLVEQALFAAGRHSYSLDGDNLRHGLCRDLGFTPADRMENIRRAGEVAKLFLDAGLIVLASFISPFRADRQMLRELIGAEDFLEIHVDASLETCMARDPNGLYAKAKAGLIPNFTGIGSPYEAPEQPDILLKTGEGTAAQCAEQVLDVLRSKGIAC